MDASTFIAGFLGFCLAIWIAADMDAKAVERGYIVIDQRTYQLVDLTPETK